jgi:hypothetical protein
MVVLSESNAYSARQKHLVTLTLHYQEQMEKHGKGAHTHTHTHMYIPLLTRVPLLSTSLPSLSNIVIDTLVLALPGADGKAPQGHP